MLQLVADKNNNLVVAERQTSSYEFVGQQWVPVPDMDDEQADRSSFIYTNTSAGYFMLCDRCRCWTTNVHFLIPTRQPNQPRMIHKTLEVLEAQF